MAMMLRQLLRDMDATVDVLISGLTADSRQVHPGDLFVALHGSQGDGRDYISSAIEAGAAAVLTSRGADLRVSVPVIEDDNPRRLYARLAARFFGRQPEVQVAVTGTNGKTSVADFTRQIWACLGKKAASVGTLGVVGEGEGLPGISGVTTPEPAILHKILCDLVKAGITHMVMEASSHGLDQHRLDGVRLQAAAFTNLTHDHLDYHKTEPAYFYAKARLFGELLTPGATAVINLDDPWGAVLEDIVWARGLFCMGIGSGPEAVIRIIAQEPMPTGQRLVFIYQGTKYSVTLPLIGDFQAKNALMAAGLVIATGGDAGEVIRSLETLKGVPGRMELVGLTDQGASVFVDYAHTPDGLQTVLRAIKAHNPNRVHVVFGCGGDRDVAKRPEMGAIAADLADCIYVTDDNPRTENPANIRSAILAACPQAMEIADRGTAIETAISALGKGDILVVAGKGHEEGQVVGLETIPFSDVETVRTVLGLGESPMPADKE